MADDPNAGGQQAASEGGAQPQVDEARIRAQIKAELERDIKAGFAARLKEVAGVDSLDALADQRKAAEQKKLHEQGEYKALAETAQAERDRAKAEAAEAQKSFRGLLAKSSIIAEAVKAKAIDPEVLYQLVGPGAEVADDGSVTVGGRPTAEAVAAYLSEHPYLAAASGNSGSGAGGSGASGKGEAPKRADFASDVEYHKAAAQHAAKQEG